MPALGRPRRPTSAISFSRSQIVRSTPGCPALARRGAWLVEVLKCRLPKPPLPPLASSTRSPTLGQIGDHRLLILLEDLGARRHAQHDIRAVLAGALPPHAGLAVLGEEMLLVAEIDQRVQPVHRLGPDIAAAAAIAAVGAAILDELLPPGS